MQAGSVYVGMNVGYDQLPDGGKVVYLACGIPRSKKDWEAVKWTVGTWDKKMGTPNKCGYCGAVELADVLFRGGVACAVAIVAVRHVERVSNTGNHPVRASFCVVEAVCLELLAGNDGEHVIPGAWELRKAVEAHYDRLLPPLTGTAASPPVDSDGIPL